MTLILSILMVIVSILLIFIVLIQNSKGGGLDSNLASSQTQILGAGKTNEVIEKITWWLAGILIFLSIFTTKLTSTGTAEEILPDETIEQTDDVSDEEL
jgi:preprotein translocase subunit SecG